MSTPSPFDLLARALLADDAITTLTAGYAAGWLRDLVPELEALDVPEGGALKHKDNLAHTFQVVHQCPPRVNVRLAALFHDIGKPATLRTDSGKVTFHHHEVVGARIATRRLTELGAPTEVIESVACVVRHSGDLRQATGWTDAAVRRFQLTVGSDVGDVIDLYRADCSSKRESTRTRIQVSADRIEQRFAEVEALDAERSRRPVVGGHEIMERYSIEPGPEVGKLVGLLLEHQRHADDELSTDDAWAFLDAHCNDITA